LSEKQDEAGIESASKTAESEPKNKAVKMSVEQAFAENEALRKEIKNQAEVIEELTAKLAEANNVLEGQEKARIISDIMPRSSFKVDQLVGKSTEELKSIRDTLTFAMLPNVNSVRFGVGAANLSDREKGLTVGDISWPTAQRRKEAD
jgi:DNA topoisomerase VI subunit B